MKRIQNIMFAAVIAVAAGLYSPAQAQTPTLGSAQNFAVLGATTVTSTGATNISGNLGVFPGTAVTGFPPGTMVRGSIYAGGPVASLAQADLTNCYADVAGRAYPPANNLSGVPLDGLKLAPGVYHFNTSAQLSASLILDAKGDPNAVFIFQIGTTLTTASNTSVQVIGGGSSDNVYWQVGSSATLGSASVLQGNILANTSISVTTGARVLGRLLAKNGAVTLDTNNVANGHWTATSIATGPNGTKQVLWYRTDGTASYWTVDASGNAVYSPAYGPYGDWRARHIALGPNRVTRILWTNKDGRMTIWTVAGGIQTNTPVFGPYPGWTAIDLAVGPDNLASVLWTHTDRRMSIWKLNSVDNPAYVGTYGPFTGWSPTNLSVGPNNLARVLWNNDDGRAALWSVDSAGSASYSPTYGPYSGWYTVGLSVGTDNIAHLLWNNIDGRASLWAVDGAGNPTYSPVYGPFANWSSTAFSMDSTGTAQLVWNNSDGRVMFSSVSPLGTASYSTVYGPYTN